MGPFSISVTGEGFGTGQPVVSFTGKPSDGAVGRGSVQEYEGALVDLCRSTAVHVLTGRWGARPRSAEGTGYALKIGVSNLTGQKSLF